MTNLEKLRAMTDEELIDFLTEYVEEPTALNRGYCSRCSIKVCEELSECPYSDRDVIVDWGNRE